MQLSVDSVPPSEKLAWAFLLSSFPQLGELILVATFSLVGGLIYVMEAHSNAGLGRSCRALFRCIGYAVAFSLMAATAIGVAFPHFPRAELLMALSFGIAVGPDRWKTVLDSAFAGGAGFFKRWQK